MPTHLPDNVYHVSFKLRNRQKGGFWVPDLQGEGYTRFRTCIVKLHLLPTMWPGMVEFLQRARRLQR